MKASELRDKTTDELNELARQLEEDVFRMRIKRAAEQLSDTSSMAKTRRDLARVKTTLRQRELGEAGAAQGGGEDG